MSLIILSARTTVLTGAWIGILLCSFVILLTSLLGFLARAATWWKIAIGCVIADLLLGGTALFLDRMGTR